MAVEKNRYPSTQSETRQCNTASFSDWQNSTQFGLTRQALPQRSNQTAEGDPRNRCETARVSLTSWSSRSCNGGELTLKFPNSWVEENTERRSSEVDTFRVHTRNRLRTDKWAETLGKCTHAQKANSVLEICHTYNAPFFSPIRLLQQWALNFIPRIR